jgi:hypothetical protein
VTNTGHLPAAPGPARSEINTGRLVINASRPGPSPRLNCRSSTAAITTSLAHNRSRDTSETIAVKAAPSTGARATNAWHTPMAEAASWVILRSRSLTGRCSNKQHTRRGPDQRTRQIHDHRTRISSSNPPNNGPFRPPHVDGSSAHPAEGDGLVTHESTAPAPGRRGGRATADAVRGQSASRPRTQWPARRRGTSATASTTASVTV